MIQLNISSKPSQVAGNIKKSKYVLNTSFSYAVIISNIINMKHGVQLHNWQNIANNQSNVLFIVSTHAHSIGLCININRRDTSI